MASEAKAEARPTTWSLDTFVERCLTARHSDDEVTKIRVLVEEAVADPAALAAALPAEASTQDEALLYAGEDLFIVHLRLTPNVWYPPHNHFMTAVIGNYAGQETNFFYTIKEDPRRTVEPPPEGVEDGSFTRQELVEAATKHVGRGEVFSLPPSCVHSVVNEGTEHSSALHVYLGDLGATRRWIWDPVTWERYLYTDATYFGLTRPKDASRPFSTPVFKELHAPKKAEE